MQSTYKAAMMKEISRKNDIVRLLIWKVSVRLRENSVAGVGGVNATVKSS